MFLRYLSRTAPAAHDEQFLNLARPHPIAPRDKISRVGKPLAPILGKHLCKLPWKGCPHLTIEGPVNETSSGWVVWMGWIARIAARFLLFPQI